MHNKIMELRRAKRRWRFVFGLPIFLGFIALAGLIIMSLWNSVIADIFAIKTISYWQAIGLIILSKILFGGFHHHRQPPYFYDRRDIEKLRRRYEEHINEKEGKNEENQSKD